MERDKVLYDAADPAKRGGLRQPCWAADFVHAASAELMAAAHNKLPHGCMLSAVNGNLVLRAKHSLSAACTTVDWLYACYHDIIAAELHTSHRLRCKGLGDTVAAVAELCFGGLQDMHGLLTEDLYKSLPPRQHFCTTWCRKRSKGGSYRYFLLVGSILAERGEPTGAPVYACCLWPGGCMYGPELQLT